MTGQLIRFQANLPHAAYRQAVNMLVYCGFSVGSMQAHAPTAAMYGDYKVAKWRNLSLADKLMTHAVIEGDFRSGPVSISLWDACPREARKRFLAEAGERCS